MFIDFFLCQHWVKDLLDVSVAILLFTVSVVSIWTQQYLWQICISGVNVALVMKLCTARHKATGEVKQKGNEMKTCYSLKFFDTISCTLWSSFSDLIFCQYLLDAIRAYWADMLCRANMPSNNELVLIKFWVNIFMTMLWLSIVNICWFQDFDENFHE